MSKTRKMPRTKQEYLEDLKSAFRAGCDWGFRIEHTADVGKQEEIGARCWLGEISIEEATELMDAEINNIEL